MTGSIIPVAAGEGPPVLRTDPTYLIATWETEHGLPENSATAMVQAPDGYLWFGTFHGLARFNGAEFTVFNPNNTPELPSAGIVNLHLDRAGRLWVSTYEGLVVGEATSNPRFRRVEGWPGNYARTFTERANGDLLITTFNGRLFEFAAGKMTELPAPPGALGGGYFGAVDEDGLWWAVQHKFIGRWENGHWASVIRPPELPGDAVACASARDGGMWLLLGQELVKLQRGREVGRRTLPGSPGGVWSLAEDTPGNVWIVSFNQGFSRVTPAGEMTRWNATNGASDQGRFAAEDREHNLWLGTSGDGLLRLTPKRFRHFELIEGRKGLAVRSVSPDPAGGVWAATYGRGLFHLDITGATQSSLLDSAKGAAYLQSVLADRPGRLWVGILDKSLLLVEGSQVRSLPPERVGGANPIALFEDSRGRTWIGGGGDAMVVFDGQTFHRIELVGDSRHLAVTGFAEDAGGTIWAVNDRSVYRWHENAPLVEVTDAGRPIRGIACLKADPDGSIWLGSFDRGLLRWKDGWLSVIGTRDGFPTEPILAMVEDQDDGIWMTSTRHLLRALRTDLHAAADGSAGRLAWQIFDASDGLPTAEFTRGRQPAATRDQDGRLWFATSKGLVMVAPDKLRLNELPPPVQVESISFFAPTVASDAARPGDARPAGTEVQTRVPGPFTLPVTLPGGSQRVEIHYAALSLTAPAKVRYQIKLDGQNEDWQDAGNRRVAYFHDLPPRPYVFRVRAANNDGVWNETGASFAFQIEPFYWQTAWFRLLLGGLAVGGVAGSVWGVMRGKLRRQEQHLAHEREIRQAREQLSHLTRVAMLGELSGSLAHELNQPLTAILSNAQAALRFLNAQTVNHDELREILQDIAADDQRAGEIIRRLRTLVKRGEVQFQPLDLNQVAQEILELVRSDLTNRSVALVRKLEPDLPIVRGDSVQLQQVFLNLIMNGCDAMAGLPVEQRKLTVSSARTERGEVQITVIDCGHGIPAGELDRIFDPFVTTKAAGLGLGLAISRGILEAHGGRLWAENNPGGGARFSFVLPQLGIEHS